MYGYINTRTRYMIHSCSRTVNFMKMLFFYLISILVVGISDAASASAIQQRVVGGAETTIQAYPYSAALLYSSDFINYNQKCGGTIISNRAVLTAAHCVMGDAPIRWRIRVGSVYANFGGTVTNASAILVHPNFNFVTRDSDIAIVRSSINFVLSNTVRTASIAGANFNLPDNVSIQAIGWGSTWIQGPRSEVLRHVQIWTVNQAVCRTRYAELQYNVTDNMLCAGWLDVGGRDQCSGDEGSPLIYNNVTVGVRSWGQGCGLARYPGVSARVTRFASWIVANA